LGLPVKSAESGFTPFLFSYAIGFFMQVRSIIKAEGFADNLFQSLGVDYYLYD